MARFPVPQYTFLRKIIALVHYYSQAFIERLLQIAFPSFASQYDEYRGRNRRKNAIRGTLVAGVVWIVDPSSLLWKNGYFGRSERGRKEKTFDIEDGRQNTQLMPEECMFLLLSFTDRLLEIKHNGVRKINLIKEYTGRQVSISLLFQLTQG
jgi:hypothetical protein